MTFIKLWISFTEINQGLYTIPQNIEKQSYYTIQISSLTVIFIDQVYYGIKFRMKTKLLKNTEMEKQHIKNNKS